MAAEKQVILSNRTTFFPWGSSVGNDWKGVGGGGGEEQNTEKVQKSHQKPEIAVR